MADLVTLTVEDHVADVRLNRPHKANALSDGMFTAIAEVIDRLRAETGVRAVVLSGEGKHFCAGADVDSIQSGGGSGNQAVLVPRHRDEPWNLFQYVACGWRALAAPVIAAVTGVAFGGGCQVALGADLRYGAPDARLSTMEIKWGLIPDMGISQTLRGLVAEDIARELLYTGRIVEADEASRLGLLTRVCADPYAEAHAIAREIASKNPDAIRAAKELVTTTWHSQDPREGLMAESTLQEAISGHANQIEAVAAQVEGRPPAFHD